MIREGLADLQSGRQTIAACLVRIAGPRARRAGFLSEEYNALLRELVSFEQALDRRMGKAKG